MAKDPGTGIERLREVAAASNLRSPLARWLSANHDEFDQLLKDFRPKWEALIEQWSVDGLLTLPPDFATNDPTRRKTVKAAMRTWDRVKAKVAKKRRVPQSIPLTAPSATVVRPHAPQPPAIPSGDTQKSARDRMRAQFKPVTITPKQET